MKAKPFLKWAGGKTQLIEQITERLPNQLHTGEIDSYVEPFIGSGAIFFHLIQNYSIKKAYISDLNADLILTYIVIKNNVESLISSLREIRDHYYSLEEEKRQEYFYEKRERFNKIKNLNLNEIGLVEIEKASLLIFLNRTCFNGLYRVNNKGGFNVPFGRYKSPKILDEDNLRVVSTVLKDVIIKCADYKESESFIDSSTFVYFDPPYRPINETSSFNAYAGEFNDMHQYELGAYFSKLDVEKKAYVMLSNSDPKNHDENDDFFDELYNKYRVERVKASRRINSKASSRGEISEILVMNY